MLYWCSHYYHHYCYQCLWLSLLLFWLLPGSGWNTQGEIRGSWRNPKCLHHRTKLVITFRHFVEPIPSPKLPKCLVYTVYTVFTVYTVYTGQHLRLLLNLGEKRMITKCLREMSKKKTHNVTSFLPAFSSPKVSTAPCDTNSLTVGEVAIHQTGSNSSSHITCDCAGDGF